MDGARNHSYVIGLFFMIGGGHRHGALPDVFNRFARGRSLIPRRFLSADGPGGEQGFSTNFLRIVVVLGLLYLMNPVISHAVVRAAFRSRA